MKCRKTKRKCLKAVGESIWHFNVELCWNVSSLDRTQTSWKVVSSSNHLWHANFVTHFNLMLWSRMGAGVQVLLLNLVSKCQICLVSLWTTYLNLKEGEKGSCANLCAETFAISCLGVATLLPTPAAFSLHSSCWKPLDSYCTPASYPANVIKHDKNKKNFLKTLIKLSINPQKKKKKKVFHTYLPQISASQTQSDSTSTQ